MLWFNRYGALTVLAWVTLYWLPTGGWYVSRYGAALCAKSCSFLLGLGCFHECPGLSYPYRLSLHSFVLRVERGCGWFDLLKAGEVRWSERTCV